jgi:hypothetical protein
MQAREMKTIVNAHALSAVVVAGVLALILAAGATLAITGGGLSLGDSGAERLAAPAHQGPTVEEIRFMEENTFSLTGPYIGSTTSEQIQFMEENLFSFGTYVSPDAIEYAEQNWNLDAAWARSLSKQSPVYEIDIAEQYPEVWQHVPAAVEAPVFEIDAAERAPELWTRGDDGAASDSPVPLPIEPGVPGGDGLWSDLRPH